MPTVRYQIRNEYGLADHEVYLAAEKDDPEALLEGVAMAGLVGLLRQLGDLAEFAAEVFHDLHEEVMATSARGHGLMLRVQQLEAEFPSIEKALLSQTDHSSCAYSAGIVWHANIRVDQNLVTQGDMPRFILDSYEECRGPPRLFMLDKFDVAGAGACLTRYSDPSFFKTASASSEIMGSELRREKRARKLRKKGSGWRSGEMTDSFFTPIIDNSHLIASVPAAEKFLPRPVRLKHRNLRSLDIINRKSYMECLLEEELLVQNDLRSSLSGSHIKTGIDWDSEVVEVLVSSATDSTLVRKEVYHMSPKEEVVAETISILSGASQKLYPNSQNAKQKPVLVGLGNRMGKHAFDLRSDEIDSMHPALQLTENNNLLADSGLITDDDHGGYGSDDIGSELENYVDALNTMESELEADSESRAKSDVGLFNSESQGTNPGINGRLELQPEFPGSGFVDSFDTSMYTEKMEDGTPILSQSTTLVDLHPELQKRTVAEATSNLEIIQVETGEKERTGEALGLLPSAYSTFNGTCFEKQYNSNTFAPTSEEASSNSFSTDSVLTPKGNFEEAQSLTVPSAEVFFAYTESTDVSQHIESSFLPWKTNHVVCPTHNEPPGIPSDIIEEINHRNHSEDRISATVADKDNMPCDISEAEHGILLEKDPAECLKGSPLTMASDELGKPLVLLEHDTNDCISKSKSPMIPVGGTFLQEPPYFCNELEIDMQSEDLPKKTSSEYIDGRNEQSKKLDSTLQFPAETHELPLIGGIDIVSHESTQKSENVYYDFEHISHERGALSGSKDYSMKDQFSGDTEKSMANDMASIFQMSKPLQTPAESSFQELSTVYVKDSLHNSMAKDNETYSVEKQSPSRSAFSLEIDSSIQQSEILDVETRNISTIEELVLPKSPASSGNADIVEQKTSIFPYIPNQLEHFSDAEEPQQFVKTGTGEPPPSDCGEDPCVNPLQTVVSELIESNGKEHSTYALELANGSAKLTLQCDQLQHEESVKGDHLFSGNGITEDCMDVQILHMLQYAKVPSFDVHFQEDPLPEKDTYKPMPSIEEPAITRDSTSLQPENKSVMPFAQGLEIVLSTASINHSSVLDLSDLSDVKLVGLNVDLCAELHPNLEGEKICSRENEHDSDLKFENFAEDGHSLLQSSNVCSLDVTLQKDAVYEDAVLNQCMPDVEMSDTADSVSKSENVITEDGTDGLVLSLLQSSYLSSFDAMFQEDPASEDASLNQLMPEIEEPLVNSELTSMKFASKLIAPVTTNGDQEESVPAVSSSHFLALNSSNFTDDKLADDTIGDIRMELDHVIYEENFMCFREDEQDTNSNVSMLHFQAESPVAKEEMSEVQSERASVAEAVHEPSKIHIYGGWVNIKPSDTHFYEVCSDEHTNIQNKLEHEVLLPEPEHETLLNNGRNNELNMPSSKTDEWEEIKIDPSVLSPCVFEHTGSSTAFETLVSGSPFVADFNIPTTISSIEVPFQALPGEVISSSQLQKDVEDAPPLPPLPPLQWRTGKPQLGSLTASDHMISVMETYPIMLPSNVGSLHINFFPPSKEENDQHTLPTMSPSALEKRFQPSSITDGHMTESLEWSELPPITMDYLQELEIQFPDLKTFQSSDHSLVVSSKEDGIHAHGNIATEAENPYTTAPSLKDVNLQHSDLFEERKPQAIDERRPKLVKLLPGLELERSQEASVIDGNATQDLSSFLFMPTAGDGKYQYAYGDYEGETMQHHNLSAPFPVAVCNVPHYGYHMFLREGNSSIYDIMLPEMEGDKPYGKPRSIRNRPRDPLIEAVAAHDKSTLRKVSELDPPLTKPAEDERNYLLEQIKNKSFNLRPAAAGKPNLVKAPPTNLKVAAILEKANAIRQACVGSDEDEDDNWSDS